MSSSRCASRVRSSATSADSGSSPLSAEGADAGSGPVAARCICRIRPTMPEDSRLTKASPPSPTLASGCLRCPRGSRDAGCVNRDSLATDLIIVRETTVAPSRLASMRRELGSTAGASRAAGLSGLRPSFVELGRPRVPPTRRRSSARARVACGSRPSRCVKRADATYPRGRDWAPAGREACSGRWEHAAEDVLVAELRRAVGQR